MTTRRAGRFASGIAALAVFGLPPAPTLSAAEAPVPSATPAAVPTPRPPLAPVQTSAPTDPSSSGNSLGDVVRKSREERDAKETKKKRSLGTITNESLKKESGKGAPEATGKKGGTMNVLPKGSSPAPASGGTTVPVAKDLKGRTEEDWKRILAKNRSDQDKAEAEVKRLELETKRLENDFYAWSDGNYRDQVIRPNWDKAREDLKKARASLDAAAVTRTDLEEDARKSGTPPGWLRDR